MLCKQTVTIAQMIKGHSLPFVLFLSSHLMIFFPEGCRGDIPQTRVTTLTIVENLNVFPYY
ncbi:hypothetical protein SGB_00283 [Shigella boydii ATCC 9905]|nr:hypothetical protein SGB_00283 [Shigella boydii ATCC 9905]